jgi:hypothetical protein
MTDFKDIGMLAAGDRVRIRNAIAKLAGRQSPNRPRRSPVRPAPCVTTPTGCLSMQDARSDFRSGFPPDRRRVHFIAVGLGA